MFRNGGTGSAGLQVLIRGYFLAPTASSTGNVEVPISAEAIPLDSAGDTQVSIPAEGSRTIQETGVGGIPTSGVASIQQVVEVYAPLSSGWLSIYPAGTPDPSLSLINFVAYDHADVTADNSVAATTSDAGQVTVSNHSNAAVSLDLVVSGYWQEPVAPDEPTGVSSAFSPASSGPGTVLVAWNPPFSDGGSPITQYTVTDVTTGGQVTTGGATYSVSISASPTDQLTVSATNSALLSGTSSDAIVADGSALAFSAAVASLAAPTQSTSTVMPTVAAGYVENSSGNPELANVEAYAMSDSGTGLQNMVALASGSTDRTGYFDLQAFVTSQLNALLDTTDGTFNLVLSIQSGSANDISVQQEQVAMPQNSGQLSYVGSGGNAMEFNPTEYSQIDPTPTIETPANSSLTSNGVPPQGTQAAMWIPSSTITDGSTDVSNIPDDATSIWTLDGGTSISDYTSGTGTNVAVSGSTGVQEESLASPFSTASSTGPQNATPGMDCVVSQNLAGTPALPHTWGEFWEQAGATSWSGRITQTNTSQTYMESGTGWQVTLPTGVLGMDISSGSSSKTMKTAHKTFTTFLKLKSSSTVNVWQHIGYIFPVKFLHSDCYTYSVYWNYIQCLENGGSQSTCSLYFLSAPTPGLTAEPASQSTVDKFIAKHGYLYPNGRTPNAPLRTCSNLGFQIPASTGVSWSTATRIEVNASTNNSFNWNLALTAGEGGVGVTEELLNLDLNQHESDVSNTSGHTDLVSITNNSTSTRAGCFTEGPNTNTRISIAPGAAGNYGGLDLYATSSPPS